MCAYLRVCVCVCVCDWLCVLSLFPPLSVRLPLCLLPVLLNQLKSVYSSKNFPLKVRTKDTVLSVYFNISMTLNQFLLHLHQSFTIGMHWDSEVPLWLTHIKCKYYFFFFEHMCVDVLVCVCALEIVYICVCVSLCGCVRAVCVGIYSCALVHVCLCVGA